MKGKVSVELLRRRGNDVSKQFMNKNARYGTPPAIVLTNPKYDHNVGAALRACSCYDISQLWYTGNRVPLDINDKKYRLPREERMKGYANVEVINYDQPLEQFDRITPIAIELRPGAETLNQQFIHPENAVYVFGPEDGSIPNHVLAKCHRIVTIPSKHCLNLAAAVYAVLLHRLLYFQPDVNYMDILAEERG